VDLRSAIRDAIRGPAPANSFVHETESQVFLTAAIIDSPWTWSCKDAGFAVNSAGRWRARCACRHDEQIFIEGRASTALRLGPP